MLLFYVLLFLVMIPLVAYFLSEALIFVGIGLAIAIRWMMYADNKSLYLLLLIPALATLGFLIQRRRDAHRQSRQLHQGSRLHL